MSETHKFRAVSNLTREGRDAPENGPNDETWHLEQAVGEAWLSENGGGAISTHLNGDFDIIVEIDAEGKVIARYPEGKRNFGGTA
jgi:hypothetical protein